MLFTTCLCLNSCNSLPVVAHQSFAVKSPDAVAARVRLRGSTFADQTAPLCPWKLPIQSPVSPFRIWGVLSAAPFTTIIHLQVQLVFVSSLHPRSQWLILAQILCDTMCRADKKSLIRSVFNEGNFGERSERWSKSLWEVTRTGLAYEGLLEYTAYRVWPRDTICFMFGGYVLFLLPRHDQNMKDNSSHRN